MLLNIKKSIQFTSLKIIILFILLMNYLIIKVLLGVNSIYIEINF